MSITLTTSNTPDLETLKKWDRLHQIHPWAAIDSWRGLSSKSCIQQLNMVSKGCLSANINLAFGKS